MTSTTTTTTTTWQRLASLITVAVLATTACAAPNATVDSWLVASRTPADPALARLDPALLAAVRTAAAAARNDGVTFVVTSGWRSRKHQQRLYAEAVERYGSEEQARRFVATPDHSAHVTGDAVDISPREADHWLIEHGSDYGLCQVFANEVWHFELATTPGEPCPEPYPDSSYRTER